MQQDMSDKIEVVVPEEHWVDPLLKSVGKSQDTDAIYVDARELMTQVDATNHR